MRAYVTMLAVIAACGGARAIDAPAPPPVRAAPDAAPEPADAAAQVPEAGPAAARRAAIVDVYDESLLFPEERARLEEVARATFRSQAIAPVDVLSADEQRALDAIRASGRVRAGGATCAAPPSMMRVVAANVRGYGIALRFACAPDGACEARLEMRDGGAVPSRFPHWPRFDEWSPLVRVKVAAPNGADATSIEAALRAATPERFAWKAPVETAPPSHPFLRGHLGVYARIARGFAAPPPPADFATEQPALDACVTQRDRRSGRDAIVVVDGSGAVVRCEGANDAMTECACRAIAKHPFARGADGRRHRVRFEYVLTPAPPTRTARVDVTIVEPEQALPDDWEWSDAVSAHAGAVAVCFTPVAGGREDTLVVHATVDESGRVERATFDASLAEAPRTCVQRALESMRLPCPLVDAQRAARWTVTVKR